MQKIEDSMGKSIQDELSEIDKKFSQDYYNALGKIQGWGLHAETGKIMEYVDAIRLAVKRREGQGTT